MGEGVFGVRHLAECFHCFPAVLLSLTERSKADWLSVTIRLLDIAQLQPLNHSDQWQFSSAVSFLLCVPRSFESVLSVIWDLLSYQTHFALPIDHCINLLTCSCLDVGIKKKNFLHDLCCKHVNGNVVVWSDAQCPCIWSLATRW